MAILPLRITGNEQADAVAKYDSKMEQCSLQVRYREGEITITKQLRLTMGLEVGLRH